MTSRFDAIVSSTSAQHLGYLLSREMQIPLVPLSAQTHPDGELSVSLNSDVKGKRVIFLATFSRPIHTNIVEYAIIRDALLRHGAREIVTVIAYMAYGRQDRVDQPGKPISLSVIADIVSKPGIAEVFVVELHNLASIEYFPVPVRTVSAIPAVVDYLRSFVATLPKPAIVSPDLRRWKWAQDVAGPLSLPVYRMIKKRLSDREVTTYCEDDLSHCDVIFVDDIISTGVSMARATTVAYESGAESVHAVAVHGVFSEYAETRLLTAGVKSIAVTNSIVTGFSCIDIVPTIAKTLLGES